MSEQSPLQRSVSELSAFLVSDLSVADTLTRAVALAVDAVQPAQVCRDHDDGR